MKSTDTLSHETVGKVEKFHQMMEEHHQSLYRYYALHTNGDLQAAFELTAKTFQLVFRKYHSFETADFRSELFGVAWDVLCVHYCRKDTEKRLIRQIEEAIDPASTRILKVLRGLPFYPREIFYLRFFAGLGVRDIALLMDKNETTVKVIVYQAILKFTSSTQGIDTQSLPWKQLVVLAQAYHLFLNDLLDGVELQQCIDDNAVRVTRQLETLRESISMTPGTFDSLLAEVDRNIQNAQHSITPL